MHEISSEARRRRGPLPALILSATLAFGLGAAARGAEPPRTSEAAGQYSWEQLDAQATSLIAAQRYAEALGPARTALDIARIQGRHERLPRSLLVLAVAQLGVGQTSEASVNGMEALNLANDWGDRPAFANALEVLGQIYSVEGNAEFRDNAYQGAIDVYRQLGDEESARRVEALRQTRIVAPGSGGPPPAGGGATQGGDPASRGGSNTAAGGAITATDCHGYCAQYCAGGSYIEGSPCLMGIVSQPAEGCMCDVTTQGSTTEMGLPAWARNNDPSDDPGAWVKPALEGTWQVQCTMVASEVRDREFTERYGRPPSEAEKGVWGQGAGTKTETWTFDHLLADSPDYDPGGRPPVVRYQYQVTATNLPPVTWQDRRAEATASFALPLLEAATPAFGFQSDTASRVWRNLNAFSDKTGWDRQGRAWREHLRTIWFGGDTLTAELHGDGPNNAGPMEPFNYEMTCAGRR